jgi:mannose-1-phosphate guanylyltransferase
MEQALMFFSADHLIEKTVVFNKAIHKNKANLTEQIYLYLELNQPHHQVNMDIS